MTQDEIKQVVDEVADLVKEYFSLQYYAGENDYIPHAIARALKDGKFRCPKCLGKGSVIYPDKPCTLCKGKGHIEFQIKSLKEDNNGCNS